LVKLEEGLKPTIAYFEKLIGQNAAGNTDIISIS